MFATTNDLAYSVEAIRRTTKSDVNAKAYIASRLVGRHTILFAVLIMGLLVAAPRGWGASTNLDRYFPRDAADSCRGGWVLADFYVSADGGVRDIEVLDSHPKGLFDEAAKRLLRLYVFHPSQQDTERRQQRIEFEAHGCSRN